MGSPLGHAHLEVSGHLDTASIGSPPRSTVEAVSTALLAWQHGEVRSSDVDTAVTASREEFARLVGVEAQNVAIGFQVSALVCVVANSLNAGAEILCPQEAFTSLLFSFLVREELTVRTVPLEALAEEILPSTDLVAFSIVQSVDGRIADTDAITSAATRARALTPADGSQACGWVARRRRTLRPADSGSVQVAARAPGHRLPDRTC